MTDIEQLEIAISQLPADKLWQFSQWFEEFMAEQWDKKIETDILMGRLDKIAAQIDEDFDAGRINPPMNYFATSEFWFYYRRLPKPIQILADKNFELLQINPRHPSLRLKKVGMFWSVRIGLTYRALAKERAEGLIWFWIGSHKEYDQLIN